MISRVFFVLMANILFAATGVAQNATAPDTEIHRLFLEDQRDRGDNRNHEKFTVSVEQVIANDAARRKRVHELLEQGVLQTGADFHDAAFIYQHGDQPGDYLLAHILAVAAVSKGDPRGRWISAATLDRYLQSIGEPQVFGTQYLSRGYAEYLRQAKAARKTAQGDRPEQKAAGSDVETEKSVVLPEKSAANPNEFVQEPYNSALISDALRAQLCVVGVEQQKKNVASINAGKGFAQRLIPGCSE